MFDVFTEEIEVIIKDGLANLYWYRGDLHKAWIRSGVDSSLCDEIGNIRDDAGNNLTKRKQMDVLYQRLRNIEYNRRLEISRNFVRILIEQKTFVPRDEKHRIEIAERAALKLKELLAQQEKDREHGESIKRRARKASVEDYHSQLQKIQDKFLASHALPGQERGYALEKIFVELMLLSQITVHEPFRITGEQIDGGIKYDGHYYLIELKWTQDKAHPKEIGSFFFKVDGKLDARGIMISMNGYTSGVIESLPRGSARKGVALSSDEVMKSQSTQPEELKVFISTRESTCGECGENLGSKAWITLVEEKGALCLACADLDHLVFLPSGDAALTRRAKKHSTLSAVVLKWSRARNRYERQGLLVEEQALEKAEEECLADNEVRERRREREAVRREEVDRHYVERFAQRVRELFPACPKGREAAIAEHACRKYSGRVGRSASAKGLDESAVRLAVIAHIRHLETDYDRLLAQGCGRREARLEVESAVGKVLRSWEAQG